jgi:hypothetical protein
MQPGQPRRRLRDVTLTGGRRLLRGFLHVTIRAACALSFLFFAFERHRIDVDGDWGPWHSYVDETAFLPLIACALTAAAAWWSRRRYPRGFVTALLAMATGFGNFVLFLAIHLFDNMDSNGAMSLVLLLQVPVFFAGLGLLIAEPTLPVLERRRLEEEEDPVFPTARLVA